MALRISQVCVLLLPMSYVLGQQTSDTISNCTSEACTQPTEVRVAPPLWCPDGFQLMFYNEHWLRVCRPLSCPGRSRNATSCSKISSTLRTCPKTSLAEDLYAIDGAGRLVDKGHNTTLELGSYVLSSTGAIVCDPDGNGSSELPRWCMPTSSTGDLTPSNVDMACPEIDPLIHDHCDSTAIMPGEEFVVLPDWSLRSHGNILHPVVYPRGEYLLAEDHSFAIICIVASEPMSEAVFYVYGAASLLSAFCLLLALVAHAFFPTLNYQARALLCLAFSFLVMYLGLAVHYLGPRVETEGANLTLFAVQYVSSLGAFLWLSILSFDLWRSTTTSGNAALSQKRIFIAKCLYAWGIPTLLCVVVIALAYHPNAHKSLGLDLHLTTISWLHDPTTALILFYTPVIIILLENVTFFVLTIVNLRKACVGTKTQKSSVNKKLFRVCIKLFVVMGLCWFFEVISGLAKYRTGDEAWYFTDVINCLQGVFIFLIYVCKKKTLLIIKHKLGYITSSQMNTATNSTQDGGVKLDAVVVPNTQ